MAVPLFGAFAAVRSEQRWRDFVARLKSEPGILVATAERNWFAPSRIAGLRDPRARDPAAIAREAKVEPARIRFAWKDYTAGDLTAVSRPVAPGATPGTVRQRGEIAAPESRHALEQFEAQFPLPPNVKANVANRTLVLAGSAPYEWIDAVRQGATKIAGITAINGDDLVVEFDPELVLQRFREQFGLPDTVQAASRGGRLLLTGEAPHEWLDRVRRGAMKLPGIHVVDDRRVVDTDQRAFHEAKAALEEVAVVFVLNRDSIPADATPTVTRATDEARRCFEAAQKLGINVMLELRGYGDAVATEAENAKLSQRRAEAVRAAIAKSGVEPGKLKSLGLGAPPPPEPGEKPGAGKFDRRVFFRVVLQP
jgi:outer membrane protein OmpA-like peptidoglycan-associated protein